MMKKRAYKLEDKIWMEGDYEEWREYGYLCFIGRSTLGNWCGYVSVKKGHPLYGKDYENVWNIDIHGGLTYSSDHTMYGNEKDVWVFGFDTSHTGDLLVESATRRWRMFPEHWHSWHKYDVYRDKEYVKKETSSLARQLHDYEKYGWTAPE